MNNKITSNFDSESIYAKTPEKITDTEPKNTGLPLPDDFDFGMDINTENDKASKDSSSAPQFREITFGAPKKESIAEREFEQLIIPESDELFENELTKYLKKKSKKYTESDGIITFEKMSIAAHSDDDFWIADDTSWFATGKQIPSPISKLLIVAGENKTSPVLYLGANNIMDLDKNISKWESAGIRVITNLDDI